MTDILTRQIQHSNHLSHQLDELKLEIIDLVKGRLSPLILQPELLKRTISNIQKLLNSKYPGFHVSHTPLKQLYTSNQFLLARQNNTLFITIKLHISAQKDALKLLDVLSFPVPMNATSEHATQLLSLPSNFAISANYEFYTTLSESEINKCTGDKHMYCFLIKRYFLLQHKATQSCILALFTNSKETVHSLCDFRFTQNSIKPSLHETGINSLVVYRSPLLSMECAKEHKMVKG